MKDGIDRRAFSDQIKCMGPAERRRRMGEFGRWMQEAARAAGWRARIAVFVIGAAVVIGGFSVALHPHATYLRPLAGLVLFLGLCLNLDSARRARLWRRSHPFEHWRAAR